MRAHTWGDDVDDVDDDDDDDDGVDDEDKDVEEWGGRWRDCDAYTPRIKKNNQNYLNIMYLITILLSTINDSTNTFLTRRCTYHKQT